MSPRFRHGDLVLATTPLVPTVPQVGNAVIVDHPDMGRIIKRVAETVDDRYVVLEGLNSRSSSASEIGRVRFERVIGKVRLNLSRFPSVLRLRTD